MESAVPTEGNNSKQISNLFEETEITLFISVDFILLSVLSIIIKTLHSFPVGLKGTVKLRGVLTLSLVE